MRCHRPRCPVTQSLSSQLQVGLAADWLRRDIIGVAESGGLQAQAYWLSTTLALGAFLKARDAGGVAMQSAGVTTVHHNCIVTALQNSARSAHQVC